MLITSVNSGLEPEKPVRNYGSRSRNADYFRKLEA